MSRSSNSPQSLLPGAEPFEFRSPGRKSAVLLIHGFTSSAYSMRELGERFSEDGHDVRGMLLPGHGTRPEELERCRWEDWYHAVENEYLSLRSHYQHVIVCGQSMGGCLGLYLASFHLVAAVIGLAVGLSIGYGRRFFLPFARPFMPFIRKSSGPDIKDPDAKGKEVHYNLMPVRSIIEFQKFLKRLEARLPAVKCPVLLVHAREDHTFQYRNMETIRHRIGSSEVQTVTLDNTYHVVTLDYDRTEVQQHCLSFANRVISRQGQSRIDFENVINGRIKT